MGGETVHRAVQLVSVKDQEDLQSNMVRFLWCLLREVFVSSSDEMIQYSYNSVSKIIFVDATGSVNFDQFKDLVLDVDKDFNAQSELRVLLDYRQAKLSFGKSIFAIELGELKKLLLQHLGQYEMVKTAVLPGTVANRILVALYRQMTRNIENYAHEIFDSYEKAVDWLKT